MRTLVLLLIATLFSCSGSCARDSKDVADEAAVRAPPPVPAKKTPEWPEAGFEIGEEDDPELDRTWVVLSWPAATDDGEILAYRVMHEDRVIGEVTGNETTFRYLPEEFLATGRYTVIAIDGDGNQVASPSLELKVARLPPKLEEARRRGEAITIPGTDTVLPADEAQRRIYALELVEVEGVTETLMKSSLQRRSPALSACFTELPPGKTHRTTIRFGDDGVGRSFAIRPANRDAKKCLEERARSVRFPARTKKLVFDVTP